MLAACSAETPETAKSQDELVPDEAESVEIVEYLFVQHAESVTLKDGLLTLEGIGDDVLYFSDRPHRIVGRKPVEWFVEAWDEGEDSFATNPPNAVLTVKKDQELVDLTLVLDHPVLTERTLVYTVEMLDGPESGTGAHAALFIDAFVKRLKDRAKSGLKRDIGRGRGGGLGGRLRGGGRSGRGRAGDRNLPRDPSGHGGARQVHRGQHQGAEIR
jgi:hypothetical protein